MTEAEWLACDDARRMLRFLQGKLSDRKLRLLALACVRGYRDPVIAQIIQVSEQYADGVTGWLELAAVRKAAKELQLEAMQQRVGMGAGAIRDVSFVANPSAFAAAQGVIPLICFEREKTTNLVRDFSGNPFRPATFSPSWRTDTAVALASQMYESRAFDRLPILADALEDAGCTDCDILDHCRGPGPHVRGCWVVDLVLDKK